MQHIRRRRVDATGATLVYPHRAGVWVTLALAPILTLVCLAVAVADFGTAPWWETLYVGAGVGLFAWTFVVALRHVRSPKPAVSLDDEAIEGAFGRIAWRDVAEVAIRWRWQVNHATRRVVLRLREGAPAPDAPQGDYASPWIFGRATLEDDRVEIPLWARAGRVRQDLARYFGPVGQ